MAISQAEFAPSAGSEGQAPSQIFIVGFGPAGQRAADSLIADYRDRIVVIDLNARNIAVAQSYGFETLVGDASHRAVLEHAQIGRAATIVITVKRRSPRCCARAARRTLPRILLPSQ